MVWGGEYSYTVLNVYPQREDCSLVRTGDVDKFTPNYGKISGSIILQLVYNTVVTGLGEVPKIGPVVTIFDIFSDAVGTVPDFFMDKDMTEKVSASYGWNIYENVSFIITNSPTIHGLKIGIGFYSTVLGTVTTYINGVTHDGEFSVGTQTVAQYPVDKRAENFGNGALAMKHYLDTGEHYYERVPDIKIISPLENNELITVVELQNPLNLNEVF